MTTYWYVSSVLALALAMAPAQAGSALAQPANPPSREVRLLVGGQFVLEPGFAVGDISVGDPAIADFRVRPGRRAVLLMGTGEGTTKLLVWDQTSKTRAEIDVIVETREHAQAETKLRALLRDFPSVKVERAGGDLIVSGTVSAEDDLALIARMATSTGAESFVRLVLPEVPATRRSGAAAPPSACAPPVSPAPTPSSPSTPSVPPVPATPGAAARLPEPMAPPDPVDDMIEYDVQVLEASIAFGTTSYETGVEPSGRVLHAGKVRVAIGRDGQIFIPGKSLGSSDIKIPASELATSGIRLTLTPTALDERQLSTRMLVETNMPIKSSSYVPGGWRRARWQSDNDIAAPFSVAGADLLVVPELTSGGGTLSKVAGTASVLSGLPGLSSVPGAGYAGYSSYVPYYNKSKKTQLLLLLRAHLVPGR
ncbi:MAG: pilus assembly protein N-terminal domain-containing protein [Acidobacteriota bacterium]